MRVGELAKRVRKKPEMGGNQTSTMSWKPTEDMPEVVSGVDATGRFR